MAQVRREYSLARSNRELWPALGQQVIRIDPLQPKTFTPKKLLHADRSKWLSSRLEFLEVNFNEYRAKGRRQKRVVEAKKNLFFESLHIDFDYIWSLSDSAANRIACFYLDGNLGLSRS